MPCVPMQAVFAVWNLLAFTVTPFEQAALTFLPSSGPGWRRAAGIGAARRACMHANHLRLCAIAPARAGIVLAAASCPPLHHTTQRTAMPLAASARACGEGSGGCSPRGSEPEPCQHRAARLHAPACPAGLLLGLSLATGAVAGLLLSGALLLSPAAFTADALVWPHIQASTPRAPLQLTRRACLLSLCRAATRWCTDA